MEMGSSVHKSGGNTHRVTVRASIIALAMLADISGVVASGAAQTPYSSYIPTAVPTATSTLHTSGTTVISPGRVAVDRAGNAFYIGHVSGSTSTLYEIPTSSPVATVSTPTPLISGLGQLNSNSAFVDASGTLWLSNGNGSGGALIEVPASNGVPNTAAITGNINYGSSGLPLTNIGTACTATSTTPCTWSAVSIGSILAGLQIGDVYSDGGGNIYLVDISDNVSGGAYNRVIQFKTSALGAASVLADKLTTNTYAQVTVAGDGSVYYCDSVTGNSSGGLVSVISGGSLTTVANVSTASLTLLNGIVKVPAATGITSDPWGNLIISGPKQLSEVPLESGVLNFADQFNLIVAVSGANAPMATNNVTYGGTFDVHGSYYYASATNIMQVQVGGYNFGKVNVGTEVTTAVPYIDITWGVPSQLVSSGVFPTASPSSLSAANASYLQSFPNGNSKNFFGGTPYSASNTGQYLLMYFQPIHAGLLRGSDSPQGYANALAASDPGGATVGATDYGTNGAYVVNLQGVGVGPQPMFLPGTASQAVALSQLYTSSSHSTKAVGFAPTSVGVDTYGDIFVVDNANSSLDVYCLATTSNTATAGSSYCQGHAPGYTYKVGYTLNKTQIPTSFVAPVDLVLDGANSVYVLDAGNGTPTVSKLGYNTMIPSVVVPSATTIAGVVLSSPQGLAIDGYSNLYIADTGNNRIVQAHLYNAAYSQNIVYVPSTMTFEGTKLSQPTGLGLDASGNLFIADTGNKRIVEYSVTGVASVVSTTGVNLVAPTGVKTLPSGALVVADSTLGLILVDNGVGSLLTTGSITLSSTQGLSLDLAGNIYVADPAGSQIVELNTNSPATTAFPLTYRGRDTSSETSFVYNSGNAALTISGTPTVTDVTAPSANEFSVNSGNGCTTGVQVAVGLNCSLIMNFTPAATADVYNPTIGAATLTDNLQSYTLNAGIGVFGNTGGTQTVTLTGQATTTFTPQTITFTTPITSVTWSSSIPPFTLSATGGPSGKPVIFSILNGQGTLSGANNNTLTVTNIGTTVIAANQAGALANGIYYGAATQATQQIVVNPIGIVATPVFSVPTGTYTAVQSVTISDSTPGATVYYTTNGNTPTISSLVYTGAAIPVNITTTIKAFAVGAPGYSPSPVATATYTLNPDFILKTYVTTFNIPNGLGGSTTLSITPLFGFTGNVVFTCSGLNTNDTCSFLNGAGAPTSSLTTTAGATVYGTLIVQANETASLSHSDRRPFAPVAVLAIALFFGGFRKRKRLLTVMLVMLSAVGASMMAGCSSSSSSGKTHTSTFTLTATSGTVVHTATITLDVNNL